MLKPKTLQNRSDWDKDRPTIIILVDSPEWAKAYANWLDGKPPTDSSEWKKGVIMTFKEE